MNLAYLLGSGDDTPHFTMKLNVAGHGQLLRGGPRLRRQPGDLRQLGGRQRGSRAPSATGWSTRTTRCTAPASTPCTSASTSSRRSSSTSVYGMNITGIRPANVTGPDKVRGSTDHVRCVVLPRLRRAGCASPRAASCACRCTWMTWAESLRAGDHVRLLRPHGLQHRRHTRQHGATWPTSCAASCPTPTSPSTPDGGIEESGNYLVDNSRLLGEFELEYPSLETWGAQHHQRRAPRRRPAAGLVWTQRRRDAKFYGFHGKQSPFSQGQS